MRRLAFIACFVSSLCLVPADRAYSAERDAKASAAGAAVSTVNAASVSAPAGFKDRLKSRLRRWAAEAAPEATSHLRELHGLKFPGELSEERPLAVLVHGLDSGRACWQDLGALLGGRGYQVAYLNYPNDQAVSESGKLLAMEMEALRREHPDLRVDMITHSMGGLVARSYIEGAEYQGGVRKLILLAPPNQGAAWARCSFFSEGFEQYSLSKREPNWHWTWAITDGLGEAGRDLRPGSQFLTELNARPRREGVEYTVIYGNRSCGWRHTGDALERTAGWLPDWRWTTRLAGRMRRGADSLRSRAGDSDGLVALESARLAGVGDLVLVPADHTTICCARNGSPPVAWNVIAKRLAARHVERNSFRLPSESSKTTP
ncbi:MAG: hypothetical protein WD847_21320 [Pirellulales bacterium]